MRPKGEDRPEPIRINRTRFSATDRRYENAPSRGVFVSGGQGQNRTADTRIFSRVRCCSRLYFSIGYRGARCPNCTTMHSNAGLIHANLTQKFSRRCFSFHDARLKCGLVSRFAIHQSVLLYATALDLEVCHHPGCDLREIRQYPVNSGAVESLIKRRVYDCDLLTRLASYSTPQARATTMQSP